MKKVVIDSFALIAFFRKETNYEVVRDLLVKIANNELEGFVCSVNAGEIYYMLCRKANNKIAEAAMQSLKQFPLQFIDPDFKLCMEAASLKAKYSFSYADAFAAALTIQKKATLITGDREFDFLLKEPHFKIRNIK